MALVDALLPEFDHEMATTRKLLERVPEDKFAWKPHVKSMSLGELAQHVATIPTWGTIALDQSEFDLAGGNQTPPASSRADLLLAFDKHVGDTRNALAGKTDAELMMPWTLKNGDTTILSVPKVGVMRSFVLNHLIHHRGQLSVYLRTQDVPLPSIYGPSADEQAF